MEEKAGVTAEALDLLERGEQDVAVLDADFYGEAAFLVADELAVRRVPFVLATKRELANLPDKYASAPWIKKPQTPSDVLLEVELLLRLPDEARRK